jgi:hypothetical protein
MQSCLLCVFFGGALLGVVGTARANDEDLDRAVLGLGCIAETQAPDSLKKNLEKVPARKFMIVARVSLGGPAAKAGLQIADVVTRINKMAVEDLPSFRAAMQSLEVGKPVEVEGLSAVEKNGRVTWRKGKLKMTPIAYRDLVLAAMTIKDDEVTGNKVYRHQQSPGFPGNSSDLQLYLVQDSKGALTPRLRIQYVDDNWLFINQFVIKCDNTTFTVTPNAANRVERDNGRGIIWEWYDVPLRQTEQEIVDAILSAKVKVILRHEGRQYQKDREIDRTEIERLRSVLEVKKILETIPN